MAGFDEGGLIGGPIGGSDDPTNEHEAHVLAQTEVRDIFQSLVKHGRTAQLYGTAHHHTRSFLDLFIDGVTRFLASHEVLLVAVEPEQLLFEGHPVLSVDGHGENLIYGLYSEGARAIGIERGASLEEITGLAELLGCDWTGRNELEDDLISAAWRREFEHVHIDIADRFSDEDEMGDSTTREDLMMGRSSGTDREHLRGDSVLVPEIQGLLAELEAGAAAAEFSVKLKQDEAAMFLALRDEIDIDDHGDWGGDVELIHSDPREAAALKREVELLEKGEDLPPALFADLIFEVVRQSPSEPTVQLLGRQLVRHLTMMVSSGELHVAAAVARRLAALCDRDLFPEFKYRESLQSHLGRLVLESNRARFATSLDRVCRTRLDRAALFSVLSLIPRNRIPELVRFGSELTSPAVRQVVADVVLRLTGRDQESLMTLLVTGDEEEAAIPLLALGRLADPASSKECLRRVGDEREAVRESALKALRHDRSEPVRAAMRVALSDDEMSVRIEALRYRSVYRDRVDLPLIERHIRSEGFGKLQSDEVKAWMMAYGHIGKIDAVSTLRSVLLGQLTLQGNQRWIQELAIRSLVAINSKESLGALDLVARKEPELRETITTLLPKRGDK